MSVGYICVSKTKEDQRKLQVWAGRGAFDLGGKSRFIAVAESTAFPILRKGKAGSKRGRQRKMVDTTAWATSLQVPSEEVQP